jgi:hypothetical protein
MPETEGTLFLAAEPEDADGAAHSTAFSFNPADTQGELARVVYRLGPPAIEENGPRDLSELPPCWEIRLNQR